MRRRRGHAGAPPGRRQRPARAREQRDGWKWGEEPGNQDPPCPRLAQGAARHCRAVAAGVRDDLERHEVNDARVRAALAQRQVQGERLRAREPPAYRRGGELQRRTLAVHLVDEADARDVVAVGLGGWGGGGARSFARGALVQAAASLACSQTVSDCASTPDTASYSATAPSRTRMLRSTSRPKSTCPGVSMRLTT